MSIIPPSSSPADFSFRHEPVPQSLSWRQRLALFFRGSRRSRYKPKAVAHTPPRLGPIGDDVLRFDTKAVLSPSTNGNGLLSDFGALKFDDQGSLAGGFNINFDLPPSTSPADSNRDHSGLNGFANGNAGKKGANGVSKKGSGARSPKRSNSRRTAGQAASQQVRGHAKAPSLEVKGLEEGGFLDTWLKESEKKEQEKEMVKRAEDAKEENKRASMISAYSIGSVSRKPMASQAAETGVVGLSRESSVKRGSPRIGAGFAGDNVPYSRRSVASTTEPVAIPGVAATAGMFGKRKAEEQSSGTSPPKMQYRSSLDRAKGERDSLMMPPPGNPDRHSPQLGGSSAFRTSPQISGLNHSPQFGSTSTFRPRDSLDYNAAGASMTTGTGTESGRSTSLASKRLSTSSMTSFTSAHYAQRLEYSRPQAGAKVVDSDAISIASTATSSAGGRRFEIKTDTGLLKPVTSTSADKAARQVSHTISRINSNTINSSTFVSPTSAPRSVSGGSEAGSSRRAGTNVVPKPVDDAIPSRRLSQQHLRNSYGDPSTGAQLSRTPTPETGPAENGATRPRRPSSRLSDRMSWINNADDPSKNNGRDFVFRKLEGGVAAKLSAFEAKASGETPVATPARGLSRSNSISKPAGPSGSGVSISESYGIEKVPTNLTRRSTTDEPGKVEDKVGEGFKKKLEGVMGGVAEKLEKKQSMQAMGAAAGSSMPSKPSESSSSNNGPTTFAQKRAMVPKSVMELIELSGVDQEIAINEYLESQRKDSRPGQLGRTKTWDHEELMKQINGDIKADVGKGKAKDALGATPEEEKTEKELIKPVEAPVDQAIVPPVESTKAIVEKPAEVVAPVVEKKVELPKTAPAPVPEPEPVKSTVAAPIVAAIPAPTVEDKTATDSLTVDEPTLEKKKSFHGAMLPAFD
jgi:hypothetical protein